MRREKGGGFGVFRGDVGRGRRKKSIRVREEVPRRIEDEGCVFAFDSHLQIKTVKTRVWRSRERREGRRGDRLRLMEMPADQSFKFME